MSGFFRFPHTPHLAWFGEGEPRADKVLSREAAADFLARRVVLEEKVDGANLGLSVGDDGDVRAQNRSHYLSRPFTGQFARLSEWLTIHEDALFDALGESLILFGEWLAAVHSLSYKSLPDYFLVFDVYDRNERRFWSTTRRNAMATALDLHPVHQVGKGCYPLDALIQVLATTASAYRDGGCEGLYVRQENDDWLLARGKLVRTDFVQGIDEHWRSQALRWNVVDPGRGRTQSNVPPV